MQIYSNCQTDEVGTCPAPRGHQVVGEVASNIALVVSAKYVQERVGAEKDRKHLSLIHVCGDGCCCGDVDDREANEESVRKTSFPARRSVIGGDGESRRTRDSDSRQHEWNQHHRRNEM